MLGVGIREQTVDQFVLRIYQPQGELSGAALCWIHGGGYIVGDAVTNDRQCAVLARDFKMVVVSVNYRLAPKHPFPAALDDCFGAWRWMREQAGALGISPARIVIGGQSAGGGLAATLVQRIHDLGDTQPLAQLLYYPMLDDRTAARVELDGIKHRLWNNQSNRAGWSHYLGTQPGNPVLPDYAAAARRADLSGLPATWIGVGDIDLFYQENCEYARRLREAGVDCELEIVPQAPHAFDMLVPNAAISKAFIASQRQFLHRVLAA